MVISFLKVLFLSNNMDEKSKSLAKCMDMSWNRVEENSVKVCWMSSYDRCVGSMKLSKFEYPSRRIILKSIHNMKQYRQLECHNNLEIGLVDNLAFSHFECAYTQTLKQKIF